MGTRSITVLNDEECKEIAVLYRQYDGYPEGHGKELAEFLSPFRVVNGIGNTNGKVANGGACLAARVIAHFKQEVGQFYLYPAGTRNVGEEFTYTVIPIVGESVHLKVEDDTVLFVGPAHTFTPKKCKEPALTAQALLNEMQEKGA